MYQFSLVLTLQLLIFSSSLSAESGRCVAKLRNAESSACYRYNYDECLNPPEKLAGCVWMAEKKPSKEKNTSVTPDKEEKSATPDKP